MTQTILAYLVVAVAAVWLVRRLLLPAFLRRSACAPSDTARGGGCGGCCGGCDSGPPPK